MAFIEIVAPSRGGAELRDAYAAAARMTGSERTAKIMGLFGLRPASMRRALRGWELAMWVGEAPRANRELVAATVSRLNHCHY